MKIPWLRNFIIIILVLGIFFRIVNLDRRFYWYDEIYTSLLSSGHSEKEVVQEVANGQVIGVKDLQKYQRLTPEKDLSVAVKTLLGHPVHPPLYYLMSRFWLQLFGGVVTTPRSLSVVFSLLVFPCVYWLCLELFGMPLVGWVAIAIIAISPFHLIYAQEARQYSMWAVMILVSSALLLRAMRVKTTTMWVVYAASVVLGLYTHLFSLFVTIAQGIYVLITERFKLNKTVIGYLLAAVTGVIAFAPWLVIFLRSSSEFDQLTDWAKQKVSPLFLVKTWIGNLSRVFFDFGFSFDSPSGAGYAIALIPLTLILLILIGYSIYFLCRNTNQSVWSFILILILVPSLAIILPDLISGGIRSVKSRYLTPAYLGIELSVAYLLATQMLSPSVNIRVQKIWRLVMITLISLGILSCVLISPAESWRTQEVGGDNPQVARIVNQSAKPLVVSKVSTLTIPNVISLSNLLEPKVKLQLVSKPTVPTIPEGFSDVFLFGSSEELSPFFDKKRNLKIEPIYNKSQNVSLWKLVK